jgi:hypothetical protein
MVARARHCQSINSVLYNLAKVQGGVEGVRKRERVCNKERGCAATKGEGMEDLELTGLATARLVET